jgi:hypothetical protein
MALYQSAFAPTNARNPFYYEMLRKLSSPMLTSSTTVRRLNYFVDFASLMFSVAYHQRLKDNVTRPPNLITSTPSKSASQKRDRKRTRERTPAQMDRELGRGHERKRKREQERNREDTMADIPTTIALPLPPQGVNNRDFVESSLAQRTRI